MLNAFASLNARKNASIMYKSLVRASDKKNGEGVNPADISTGFAKI